MFGLLLDGMRVLAIYVSRTLRLTAPGLRIRGS